MNLVPLIKRVSASGLAALVLLSAPAQAGVPAEAGVRQALQSAYAARNSAAARKDVSAALALYAPGFVYVSPEGNASDRPAARKLMAGLFATARAVGVHTRIKRLTLHPEAAVAVCEQDVSLVLPDRSGPSGRAVLVRDITRDVWTRQQTGWKLVRSRTLQRTQTEARSRAGENHPVGVGHFVTVISH